MKRTAELERQTNYELRTFSSFNDEFVDPEKVEKYQRFMPGADERILAMVEKEQDHRHRLQKTQMETWSRIVILKMWILTTFSVGVFSNALLCIYHEKITEGLSLIGGSNTGSAIFKTLKGQ